MDIVVGTGTALEDPNKRSTELKKAMIQALKLDKSQILLQSDDKIVESKRRAYNELSGLVVNLLDKDAMEMQGHVLSPKFDTTMAAKSAMFLAGMTYALDKNNVTGAAINEFAAGVTTQDDKIINYVSNFFDKKQFTTRAAGGKTGTVSKETIMQDIDTFFKTQFGIELKKAMVVQKIEDLKNRIG